MTARTRSRFRTLGLAAAVVAGAGHLHTSSALVRPKGAEAPAVATRGGRPHRTLTTIDRAGQLARTGLATWQAQFDDDTGVPLRMWGSTPAIAHVVDDATVAEAASRAFLANHLGVLAPGAALADFTLLANQLGPSGIRTVTFQQHAHGIAVQTAAVNFAFKADRLMMVGSTALPHVAANVVLPTHAIAPAAQLASATRWLAEAGHAIEQQPQSASFVAPPRVIVPIVRPRLGATPDITYTVADELAVDAIAETGSWKVWLDAESGAPIARASTISWATSSGAVMFDVPDQSPTGTRSPHPAPLANLTVNGVAQTSTLDGVVTWDGTSAATVVPALVGSRVRVVNKSGTAAMPTALSLAPNGTATWSQASTPTADANLDAFVYANHAKEFTKTRLNPNLAWLDQVMTVNVNVNQTCNANSNGDSVNFFIANAQCENTGRIADVVYHETGHSVHNNSVIPGAGAFGTTPAANSLSEGMADTMAVSITGDHGVGRGFFFNDQLLRDLAPATPKHWPEAADGEPHDEGEVIGEALWDMRQALQASLGVEAGYAQTLKIYYNIMQRSPDIPGAFAEALAADDDNGDLTDGTPNLCTIKTAFDRHGLAADTAVLAGTTPPTRDNFTIAIKNPVSPAASCGGAPTATGAHVEWRLRGGTSATLPLTLANGSFTGQIPQQPDGAVVEYRVTLEMSDQTSVGYPNNPADPYYQFYVGTPTKLWCTDFENGASEWMHAGTADEWQVGAPMGLATDPKTAFSGTNVFGTDLSNDGLYSDNGSSYAQTPAIDLMGNTTNVHLQYQRWLGVEDGVCDTASIQANGKPVWKNFASPTTCANVTTEVNHLDKEWRFQDVDVSAQAAAATDGKLTLKFDLTADQGLGFGGWTIDDVCLVVTKPAPTSTCGDGVVSGSETCDDGNGVDGDGCSASCQLEGGKDGGGCCSSSTEPTGALALGTFVFGALIVRRRRRR